MNFLCAIIILTLSIIAFDRSERASADIIHGLDDIDDAELVQLEKLAPYFAKLNDKLSKKLPPNGARTDMLVQLASEIRAKLGSGCASILKRTEKKAWDLFVSLEETVGECDTHSYEILYRNQFVNDKSDFSLEVLYTSKATSYYRGLHAKHCRPIHRQKFAKKLEDDSNRKALERVARLFSTLDISDFGYVRESDPKKRPAFDLVGMKRPQFAAPIVKRSLMKISRQIIDELAQDPSVDLQKAKPSTVRYNKELLKSVLAEYLFEPCANFRAKFAQDMNEARYDARYIDEHQVEYIEGDENFHSALVANGLCGALLKERDNLYWEFSTTWGENWEEAD